MTEILEVREPRAETAEQWAARGRTEAPLCGCGCGTLVELKARHRAPTKGVPRYVPGHHPNPLRQMYLQIEERTLLTTAQVCRRLGISESSYHRFEAAGVFPAPSRWGKWPRPEMRVFTAATARALASTLARHARSRA